MPTLFRFLTVLAMIAATIYGSMVALSVLVVPREREVTVRIPSERLNPPKDANRQASAP
jgi:predicted membrane protein